ncbi:MAG: putative DNA binding domain-containing protein [Verrucomicrobia bacterium]|nr:putative DNA binding domain-containing protein [Verrucomicrobiota bacterium]
MLTTDSEFVCYLNAPEGAQLEFKEAKTNFHFEELVKYCVALANERGGKIILGVSDARPRQVVGTSAFLEPGRTEAGLFQNLHHRIPIEEYLHEGKRVLIFHVPSCPPGEALSYKGTFFMRSADALVGMTSEQLRAIHAEIETDFSAEACPKSTLADLDPTALSDFRARWARRSANERLLTVSPEQVLTDADLLVEGKITFASLILLGTRAALSRHLAPSEVIFEYRSSEVSGPAQERHEFREGLLRYHDRLWELINKRNDRQSYQDGFFRFELPTFDEQPVREAILNAVCHRDYRAAGSVFVRQFSRRLEVISPGGWPPGVTTDNVLDQQQPRNRRLAEAFSKCGLVERAGQGMNLMFERAIMQSKPLPDFTGTAAHEVRLTLQGTIQSPAFLRFLEKVGQERMASFSTHDFLILDLLQREQLVPDGLKTRLAHLKEHGIIESVGRGRGTRYLLARKFHQFAGETGVYTRRRGLDKETNKELLLKHIRDSAGHGAQFGEFHQVLPSLSRQQLATLLRELRTAGKIQSFGVRRAARWFLAQESKTTKKNQSNNQKPS